MIFKVRGKETDLLKNKTKQNKKHFSLVNNKDIRLYKCPHELFPVLDDTRLIEHALGSLHFLRITHI